MLACCPSLVDLELWDAVVPGSLDDERFWRGFEGIWKLHLDGIADVHIPLIVRYLPKLQELGVFEYSLIAQLAAVTAPAVMSLTALTGLSKLQIHGLPIAGSGAATVIMLRTPPPQGPPVWEQLLMFGLRHSDSRPVLQQQVQRLQEELQRPPYAATLSRNSQLPAELRELEAEAWTVDLFV